eukprot:Nk52_evm61s62 gene=Nk52_evmTU61s62
MFWRLQRGFVYSSRVIGSSSSRWCSGKGVSTQGLWQRARAAVDLSSSCQEGCVVGSLSAVLGRRTFCDVRAQGDTGGEGSGRGSPVLEYSFPQRTHRCGEVTLGQCGEEVVLAGWLYTKRLYKGHSAYIDLKDRTGRVQLSFNADNPQAIKALDKVSGLSNESVIGVRGFIQERPEEQKRPHEKSGDIEVIPTEVFVLNVCQGLPFHLDKAHPKESTRMKYRYLDIRRPAVNDTLRLRSDITYQMRKFLIEKDFLEIETPTLFKRTPEGAREFVVPTRNESRFYSLVQSPQQYKQLLMVGGVDKYFQFARCYRDEDMRADRQPEFTQLDMELSFVSQNEIQTLIEDMIQLVLREALQIDIKVPFLRMQYADAMRDYGVDKPDLRFEMKIQKLTAPDVKDVLSIVIPKASSFLSRKKIATLIQEVSEGFHLIDSFCAFNSKGKMMSFAESTKHKGVVINGDEVVKSLGCKEGDVVLACKGTEPSKLLSFMGRVRLSVADALEREGCVLRKPGDLKFLWVENFPLFEKTDEGSLESSHHPFTSPVADDIPLLLTDPEKVRGQHYDIVLNGMEIGGGSIRVHDAEMQRVILEKLLKAPTNNLQHLLNGLASGCPPHGGIALGYDRFLSAILNTNSIRDVIAFPKGFSGRDLMVDSPSPLSTEELAEYGLKKI